MDKSQVAALRILAIRLFALLLAARALAAWGQAISGDIDGSGRLDRRDLALIESYLAGETTFDQEQSGRADANGDGRIDRADAQVMARQLGIMPASSAPIDVTVARTLGGATPPPPANVPPALPPRQPLPPDRDLAALAQQARSERIAPQRFLKLPEVFPLHAQAQAIIGGAAVPASWTYELVTAQTFKGVFQYAGTKGMYYVRDCRNGRTLYYTDKGRLYMVEFWFGDLNRGYTRRFRYPGRTDLGTMLVRDGYYYLYEPDGRFAASYQWTEPLMLFGRLVNTRLGIKPWGAPFARELIHAICR